MRSNKPVTPEQASKSGQQRVPVFVSISISIVLLCSMSLSGCGSGSISGSSTPVASPSATPAQTSTPTPSPTPAVASKFIFGITVFETSNGYQSGVLNNGTVTPIANDFNDAGLGQNIVPQLIADPQGRFLYGVNLGASSFGIVLGNPGITEMQINQQTGALTRVPGSPLTFPSSQDGMLAIDGTGHFLYQPNAGFFDIYSIDQTIGLLTKTSTSTATSLGFFTVISPDGRFLFNNGNQLVESLSIGSDGSLTMAQSPISSGGPQAGLAGQLAVSADSKFLFVLNQGSVGIFNIGSTGSLTPVIGSPFTTDPAANGFSLSPDGRHLYIAFQPSFTGLVKGFTFDPVASTLTPIAGAVITDNALTVTIDGSGKFAYLSENRQLVTYGIDPTSGALTRVSQTTKPVSESPQSMVVVP